SARITGLLRAAATDIRDADEAGLVLINPDTVRPAPLPFALSPLPSAAGAPFAADEPDTTPLRPGEVRILRCHRTPDIVGGGPSSLARTWAESARIAVEAVQPVVPGGDFPAKTVVGTDFTVSADVFGDGHDVLAADVLWRAADETTWQRVPMARIGNDR